MNQTTVLLRVIQGIYVASILTLGSFVATANAATLTGTIPSLSGDLSWDGGDRPWEGTYEYSLSYTWDETTMMGSVTIEGLSSPENNQYQGWNTTVPITSFDSSTDPPTIEFEGQNFTNSN